jgi:hypothetical protein
MEESGKWDVYMGEAEKDVANKQTIINIEDN